VQPDPAVPPVSSKRHRPPAEIISHGGWRSHRFGRSLRDVQELLAERGVAVTYESIHRWGRKFGPAFAAALRRRRPRAGDT
jgi:putative transposase